MISESVAMKLKTQCPLCICLIVAASNAAPAFFPLIHLKQAASIFRQYTPTFLSEPIYFLVCFPAWLQGWNYPLSIPQENLSFGWVCSNDARKIMHKESIIHGAIKMLLVLSLLPVVLSKVILL